MYEFTNANKGTKIMSKKSHSLTHSLTHSHVNVF